MATDFYQILGVESHAPPEEIKRRYRLLVRENHPDVSADKVVAHARMQEILLAWNTLSDPHKRARYDIALHAQARKAQSPPPQSSGGAPDAARPRSTPSRPAAKPKLDPQQEARRSARVNKAMGGQGATRSANPRTRLLTMVFDAAQLYYVEGNSEEAMRVAKEVLRADPTNAEAAVLLGDINAERGQKDAALAMYERAVRLQPANLLYRQKLETLRHSDGRTTSPAPTPRTAGVNPWAKAAPRPSLSDRINQGATMETNGVAREETSPLSASDDELVDDELTDDVSAPQNLPARTTASSSSAFAAPAPRGGILGKLRTRWSK